MTARDRRAPRVVEAAPSQMTAEQHAFAQGKRAAASGQRTNPYRNLSLRVAWDRGYLHESNTRRGLRPLDTARRKP